MKRILRALAASMLAFSFVLGSVSWAASLPTTPPVYGTDDEFPPPLPPPSGP